MVHLAAIVGDPACASDPELSAEVNVEGPGARCTTPARSASKRIVFASTCSNYGRMADPTVPIDEAAELAPVSLYAEQKVGVERELLGGRPRHSSRPACASRRLRRGAADALRPDRERVHARPMGRPHASRSSASSSGVRTSTCSDAARGIRPCSTRRPRRWPARSSTSGTRDENYRKLDLVELITGRLGRGDVTFVRRDEDPRDYKVSFEKVREQLGFAPKMACPRRDSRDHRRPGVGALRRPVRRRLRSNLGRTIP